LLEIIPNLCFLLNSNDKEVVYSVKDLHSVGTFCGIVEMQDMGDRLRMIVMAHRRVRLIGQVVLDEKELEGENDIIQVDTDKNGRRRRQRRRPPAKDEDQAVAEDPAFVHVDRVMKAPASDVPDPSTIKRADAVNGEQQEGDATFEPVPVLMIEAENIQPLQYEMDTEIKVHLQSVVNTVFKLTLVTYQKSTNSNFCVGFSARSDSNNQRHNAIESFVSRIRPSSDHAG